MDISIPKSITNWVNTAATSVKTALAPVVTAVATPDTEASAHRPPPGPAISVVNLSTVVTSAQVQAACAAIQIQINRDFYPVWGFPATVTFFASTAMVPMTSWVIQVLDTSDQAGALGYHTLTSTDLPDAKILAADDRKYGLSWTVTLSHEILEMIGDPYTDTCVFAHILH